MKVFAWMILPYNTSHTIYDSITPWHCRPRANRTKQISSCFHWTKNKTAKAMPCAVSDPSKGIPNLKGRPPRSGAAGEAGDETWPAFRDGHTTARASTAATASSHAPAQGAWLPSRGTTGSLPRAKPCCAGPLTGPWLFSLGEHHVRPADGPIRRRAAGVRRQSGKSPLVPGRHQDMASRARDKSRCSRKNRWQAAIASCRIARGAGSRESPPPAERALPWPKGRAEPSAYCVEQPREAARHVPGTAILRAAPDRNRA